MENDTAREWLGGLWVVERECSCLLVCDATMLPDMGAE